MSEQTIDKIFLDRKEERPLLLEALNDSTCKLIIIKSKKGIGKSGLIHYIMEETGGSYVQVTPKVKQDYFNNGVYINEIARKLSAYEVERKGLTFEYFIKTYSEDESIKEKIDNAIKETDRSKFLHTFIANRLYKGQQKIAEFETISDDPSFVNAYKYLLHYVTSRHDKPLSIIIENVESIDALSLDWLTKIIEESVNIKFILEFTSNTNGDEYDDIIKAIHELKPYPLFLKALPFEHYKELIILKKSLSDEDPLYNDHEYMKQYYHDTHGNLYEINNILENYEFSPKMIQREVMTCKQLSCLKKDELFVLHLIYTHDNKVQRNVLSEVYDKAEVSFMLIDNILRNIEKLIQIDYLEISIGADVAQALQQLNDTVQQSIAKSLWYDYYETKVDSAVYNDNLLYFYIFLIKVYPEKLLSYKKGFLFLISSTVDVGSASDYCRKIEAIMSESQYSSDELYKFLIEVYCFIGNYEYAYQLFHKFPYLYDEDMHYAYECFLLNRLCKYVECRGFITSSLSNTEGRIRFYLKNIEIINLANLTLYGKALEKYQVLEKQQEQYQNYPEFGFFLRNATIVYSPINSLPYIQRSIDFFKDDSLKCAKSHITYSMNCARIGNYEEALEHLEIADKRISKNLMERHIILNNEVCIHYMKGTSSTKMIKKLYEALLTTTISHDRIRIHTNMIAVAAYLGQFDICEDSITALQPLLEEHNNPSLQNKAYNNIISYYFQIGQDTLAKSYQTMLKIANKKFSCSPETQWRIDSVTALEEQSEPNFIVCFISYWHFEMEEFSIDSLIS